MEFDTEEKVEEGELDTLGLQKKDNADVDTDVPDEDAIPVEGEEQEDTDQGIFGDDAELENYMLSGYEENN